MHEHGLFTGGDILSLDRGRWEGAIPIGKDQRSSLLVARFGLGSVGVAVGGEGGRGSDCAKALKKQTT